jgi:hypothetical protein
MTCAPQVSGVDSTNLIITKNRRRSRDETRTFAIWIVCCDDPGSVVGCLRSRTQVVVVEKPVVETVVDDGAGGGMVLLGPPFKFNADNIDDWKDVY